MTDNPFANIPEEDLRKTNSEKDTPRGAQYEVYFGGKPYNLMTHTAFTTTAHIVPSRATGLFLVEPRFYKEISKQESLKHRTRHSPFDLDNPLSGHSHQILNIYNLITTEGRPGVTISVSNAPYIEGHLVDLGKELPNNKNLLQSIKGLVTEIVPAQLSQIRAGMETFDKALMETRRYRSLDVTRAKIFFYGPMGYEQEGLADLCRAMLGEGYKLENPVGSTENHSISADLIEVQNTPKGSEM